MTETLFLYVQLDGCPGKNLLRGWKTKGSYNTLRHQEGEAIQHLDMLDPTKNSQELCDNNLSAFEGYQRYLWYRCRWHPFAAMSSVCCTQGDLGLEGTVPFYSTCASSTMRFIPIL